LGTPLAPGEPLLLIAISRSARQKEAPAQPFRGFSAIRLHDLRLFHSILTGTARNRPLAGNKFNSDDLVCHHLIEPAKKAELAMNNRKTDDSIDGKTSRSICDAVGERLRRDLQSPRPSSHLQHLMDELRLRDRENRLKSSN
jgi:hypothetical protein